MTRLAVAIAALLLVGASSAAVAQAPATAPIDCPASVGADVSCLSGQDLNGAWYVIAMPADWNRRLIVHAHGGPRMGEPQAEDPLEDLDRFSVMVRQGYAWIGSTYRRGGYGVRMAAADTDNSRQIFWSRFGRPERTLLHGQSWGGNVAAKVSELYALDIHGARNYDGVLITNGVVSGGTRAYQFRAGLRAVYQFYCRNHPAPDEPAYPVWPSCAAGSRPAPDSTRASVIAPRTRRAGCATYSPSPASARNNWSATWPGPPSPSRTWSTCVSAAAIRSTTAPSSTAARPTTRP